MKSFHHILGEERGVQRLYYHFLSQKGSFMPRSVFDTLAFANRLKQAGCDPVVAETEAEAISEMLDSVLEQNTHEQHRILGKLEYRLHDDVVKASLLTIFILGGLYILTYYFK